MPKISSTQKAETRQVAGLTVVLQRVAWRRSRYVMRLRPDGTVAALIPPRWNDRDINDMLHKHRRWLAKRAAELLKKQAVRAAQPPAHLASPLPALWHKRAAAVVLPPRVAAWARRMRLSYSKISISSGRRTWGTCDRHRHIRLSYRLLLVPHDLADYVIIHELAHLAHLNHGPKFWGLVAKYVPDYVAKRRALNKLGAALD